MEFWITAISAATRSKIVLVETSYAKLLARGRTCLQLSFAISGFPLPPTFMIMA